MGGDIEQADATLTQRRAELEDLKLQVEGDIRKVYFDLEAATSEVEVAQRNARVAKETLDLTRRRVEAGVADSVELVQSQEALAGAELDYINSVFSHNVAKLSLARSLGTRARDTHVQAYGPKNLIARRILKCSPMIHPVPAARAVHRSAAETPVALHNATAPQGPARP